MSVTNAYAENITNTGEITADITISSEQSYINDGHITGNIENNGTFLNRSNTTTPEASDIENDAIINNADAIFNNNGKINTGTITNNANANFSNSGTITAENKIINNGTLSNKAYDWKTGTSHEGIINADIENNGTITYMATINGNLTNNAGAVVESQTGILAGNLDNAGTFKAYASITKNVTNYEGGTINALNNVGGNVTNKSGGIINTLNNVQGNVLNEEGAQIQGAISLNGTLTNDGTIDINTQYLKVGNQETKTGDFINNGTAKYGQGHFFGNVINNKGAIIDSMYANSISGGIDNKGTYKGAISISGNDPIKNYVNNSGTMELSRESMLNGIITNAEGAEIKTDTRCINGCYINVGNAVINNSGTIKGLNSNGNANVTINNSETGKIELAGGSWAITSGGEIKNAGTLTALAGVGIQNQDSNNLGKFINTGTADFQQGGGISVDIENEGTFNFKKSGSLSGNIVNSGIFNVDFEGGGSISNFENRANATANFSSTNPNSLGINQVKNAGTINNHATIHGTLENTNIINNTGQILSRTINSGTIINKSGSWLANEITNQAGGKIVLEDGSYFQGTFENSGIFENKSSDTRSSGQITNQSGGKFINFENSVIRGSVTNQAGGTITNSGTLASGSSIYNDAGATLINEKTGIIEAGIPIANSGTLSNAGIIKHVIFNKETGKILNSGTISDHLENEGALENTGQIAYNEAGTTKSSIMNQTKGILNNKGTIGYKNEADGKLSLFINYGKVTNEENGVISARQIINEEDATLSTAAENIITADNTIQNAGTLVLTSGTNANTIKGYTKTEGNTIAGTVAVSGDVDLGTGKITENAVEVRNGNLKVSQNDNLDSTVALKVQNGGAFDVNDKTATLKDAEFAAGSTLKLNVNTLDSHGSLKAEKITVEDGATLNATLAQGLVNRGETAEIKLLTAENEDFNNFSDKFDNNMYRFEKSGKNGAYTISLAKTAAEIAKETGASNTQVDAAKAWVDGKRFNNEKAQNIADQLADIAQNDSAELGKTLETIAPAEAPVVHDMTTDVNDRILQATVDHLKYGAAANMYGMSSGDEFDEISVWGKTYLSQTDRETTSGIQGFKVKSHGVVGGFDKKLNKATKLGVGIQYDTADIKSPNRKTDVDSLTGFIYGQYRPDNRFINWLASYGKADYDENKFVLNQNFNASYDAKTYALPGVTGYDLYFNDYKITPEAGLRYYNIHRSSYTDGLSQRIKSQDMDILRAAAGVSVAKDFCVGLCKITPEVYIGLTYDIIEDSDKAVVMLDNGASYTVNGQRLNRLGFETTIGLTAALNDSLELSISYNGTYRKDYDNHMGLLNAKYKF